MENSPLKFLDYDVSLMLADQVKISQEDYARKYHHNLYRSSTPGATQREHGIICRAFKGIARSLGDIWDEDLSGAGLKSARYIGRETIKRRIILYEQELIIIMNRRVS